MNTTFSFHSASVHPRKATPKQSELEINEYTLAEKSGKQSYKDIAESNEVKVARDRWTPKAKETNLIGMLDDKARDKPAIDFLADPTKVGLLDYALNFTLWAILPEAIFHAAKWGVEKYPTKMPDFIANVMKDHGANYEKFALLGLLLGAGIQVPFSMSQANKQAETNVLALESLEAKGLKAKLKDF